MKTDLISKVKDLVVQAKALGSLGITLRPDDGSSEIFKHPILFLYFLVSTVLSIISKLWYGVKYSDGIADFTNNLVYCTAGVLGLSFIFLLIFRITGFRKLFDDFETVANKVTSSERKEIELQSRTEKLFVLIVWILFWLVGATMYIPPLILGLICFLRNQNVKVLSSIMGSYPYDNEKPAYFLISWLMNSSLIFLTINSVAGVDGLFSWCIHSFAAHFNILCNRFVIMGRCLQMECFDDEQENIILKQLNELIAYHSKLIVLVKQMDKLFAPFLFVIVLFGSIEICLVVFQLQVQHSINDLATMMMGALACLVQTMIFCFGGQKIKNHSEKLCQEIYLSIPWHVLKKPTARLMLITLNRAQAGNHLKGYFFIADCKLFVAILKSASSLGALFRAMKDDE